MATQQFPERQMTMEPFSIQESILSFDHPDQIMFRIAKLESYKRAAVADFNRLINEHDEIVEALRSTKSKKIVYQGQFWFRAQLKATLEFLKNYENIVSGYEREIADLKRRVPR